MRLPGLLRQVAFRRYWLGQTISLFGDGITSLAMPLVAVLVLHATPAAVGELTSIGLAPFLMLSIPAGIWVDHTGQRRRAMILADVGRACALAAVPLAYVAGDLHMGLVFAVATVVGAFSVVFNVASSSVVGSIVTEGSYVEASSLTGGSRAAAQLAGPSVAGFLVQALSAPIAILGDAASFVASALSLASIHPKEPAPSGRTRGESLAGLRLLWRSAFLRPVLLSVTTINLFNFMFQALFVLYATRNLGVQPATLGVIVGSGAAGTALGALISGRISGRIGLGRTLLLGTIVFPGPLVLVPLAGVVRSAVVGLLFVSEFASGFGVMLLDISFAALFLVLVPEELRSRTSGAFTFVNYGIRPIGALIGGMLPALMGVQGTMWLACWGALLGVLWLLPSKISYLESTASPTGRSAVCELSAP